MATPVLGDREVANVTQAVRSGWISSHGEYVGEFEQAFSRYCGAEHGIAVSSGTAALHLALAALGVGPGDEVIVPASAHIACANMVCLTGAAPVLADSSPESWCIDPAAVETRITPRTAAIMVIHLYGNPAEMDPILEVAGRHGLRVIEDAAQAHGADYRGRRTGNLGDLACFSFYANKIVTTGEGGMVVTGHRDLADRCRKLSDQAYGDTMRFKHDERAFNYRLTNLQAAVGMAQMEQVDRFVEIHRRNARLFNELLADVPGVTLPPQSDGAASVYWMYSILVGGESPASRDDLMTHLREHGVDSRPFFHPVHLQAPYAERFAGQRFPVAEELALRGLNLPSGNDLTEEQVRYIAGIIRRRGEAGRWRAQA